MSTSATSRTRLHRLAERGHHERTLIHCIIDEAWHCHIAVADEQGDVHCIPMACWRVDDSLCVHGSNGSRLLKRLAAGAEACVIITHLDGLVPARSAFNHSMNYRSVLIYGRFEIVPPQDKVRILDALMERIAPLRVREARPGNQRELNATQLLRLPLIESVAEVRAGGPQDDAADMSHPVWAGVLPLRVAHGAPERDPACALAAPSYVTDWPR